MLFCIRVPDFVQIGPHIAEIWRHNDFARWQPRLLSTTSGVVFVAVTAFRRSKSVRNPNFVYISHSRLRYDYFRFGKTNVRHIGILLRFRFRPFYRKSCDIMHETAERHPCQNTQCVNMTSYWFLGRLRIRSTSKSRPNNIRGKKCLPVRPSVRTSVRPQKVSSIWMKVGI